MMGEEGIYAEFHNERIRAHQKHDPRGGSMERKAWNDAAWLPVVGEEFGEVCRALTYDQDTDHLREELVQLGAMTAAWIAALDYVEDPETADTKFVHSTGGHDYDPDRQCPRCEGGHRLPSESIASVTEWTK